MGATPEQRAIIEQAVRDADAYIDNALKALSGPVTNPSSRYTTWFGKSDTDRFKHVRSAFIKISDQAENLEYDVTSCVHPGDVFAYVYPDQYGTVYLCSQFWKAPATGADSKAGTLVHEETHFTRNGGTDDHVYGAKRCKQLAKDDPAEAVMNADSYEYFAENTPRV